jgi:hypothetical protein
MDHQSFGLLVKLQCELIVNKAVLENKAFAERMVTVLRLRSLTSFNVDDSWTSADSRVDLR